MATLSAGARELVLYADNEVDVVEVGGGGARARHLLERTVDDGIVRAAPEGRRRRCHDY